MVEKARDTGLSYIYQQLNITKEEHKSSFNYLRTLRGQKNVKFNVGYNTLMAKNWTGILGLNLDVYINLFRCNSLMLTKNVSNFANINMRFISDTQGKKYIIFFLTKFINLDFSQP